MQNARNNRFLLALGANLGVEAAQNAAMLHRALATLEQEAGTLGPVSAFYRTPAFPADAGGAFVNACVAFDSALPPHALLGKLHDIEAAMGRVRQGRWGPRVIDLDLLAMDNAVLPDAEQLRHWMSLSPDEQMRRAPDRLILPHPRLHERAFVLVPLADIAPEWTHPLNGQNVQAMLAALPGHERAAISPL